MAGLSSINHQSSRAMKGTDIKQLSHADLCRLCNDQRRTIESLKRTRAILNKKVESKDAIIEHLTRKEKRDIVDAIRQAMGDRSGGHRANSRVLPGELEA